MKFFKILVILLFFTGQLYASKRGTWQTAKSHAKATVTKGGLFRPSGINQAKTLPQATQCPRLQFQKQRVQRLTTESTAPRENMSTTPIAYEGKTPSGKNPWKTMTILGGIGTTIGGGTHLYKKHSNESEIQNKIKKLTYAVSFYNPLNEANKNYVIELINQFGAEGIINEKDTAGNTPLMIILRAHYIAIPEKAALLTLLFKNGAQLGEDKQEAVNIALGLNKDIKNLKAEKLQFNPNVKLLKRILPHCDIQTVQDLVTIYDEKIKSAAIAFNQAQEELHKLEEEKGIFGFTFNRENRIKEEIIQGRIASSQNRLDKSLKIKKIAEKSLHPLPNEKLESKPYKEQDLR